MKRRPRVRAKTYDVIVRAVEEGVRYGLQRAHKHTDDPVPDEIIIEAIENAVLNALCEALEWD